MSAASGTWASMVTVGRIVRPHGNRGHVVVDPETDFAPDRFRPGGTLHWSRNGVAEAVVLTAAREHQGRWVIGVKGIDTIAEAEALRGLELRIPAEALRPLPPGRYYVHDLVGSRVETTAGATVGSVQGVDFSAGTPVLVVTDGTRERLIPFTEDICRRIDQSTRTIVIDPPEGLLELND